MRKLTTIVLAFLAMLEASSAVAHSAAPPGIVAGGAKSLLVVDAGRDRIGLIDIRTGAVRQLRLVAPIESAVLYDASTGAFRFFARATKNRDIALNHNISLCSINDGDGALTSVEIDAVAVEAFVKSESGQLFAAVGDGRGLQRLVKIGRNGMTNIVESHNLHQPVTDLTLSGPDVITSGAATVLMSGGVEALDLPLSTRKDRLWQEVRLSSGWLVIDPMTGDIRWSKYGKVWEQRPSLGGSTYGAVMPYSTRSLADGGGAFVVSTIGNARDRRRLLSRVDTNGFAFPILEFGKELDSLIEGRNAMWLVGSAVDEPTIRYAVVTAAGIGPIRKIAWPPTQ
jgi:hypothetical protein